MKSFEIENPILTIQIALAGKMPSDANRMDIAIAKIKRVICIAQKQLAVYASEEYGFANDKVCVRFLTSPDLLHTALLSVIKRDDICPEARFFGVSAAPNKGKMPAYYDDITVLGEEVLEDENNLIFSWICDQADFAIILTDKPNDTAFLRHCKTHAIPSAVIQTSADGLMFWTLKSAYDSFDEGKLKDYLQILLPQKDDLDLESETIKTLFGYKMLWGNLYKKYLKKYKAILNTDKPFTKDTLMDNTCEASLQNQQARTVRSFLLKWFYGFDKVAIAYAEKYRSSIYLRAVIPLFINIFLAVGFYIEIFLSPFKVYLPGSQLQLWSIVAGLAFFIHASLNLYVFRLSENNTAKKWHKGFINNRFIAEALRLATHFMSFGVPINYTKFFSGYGSKLKKDSPVLKKLRTIIRSNALPAVDFDGQAPMLCLQSLNELLDDQIAYHESSAKRYENIFKSLKHFGKIVFYLGFCFVLFRGCLQLFVSFTQIPGEVNGQALQPIIKAFANMLALLFPVWAAYFSSKLVMCNFEGLYNNDLAMLEGLKEIMQTIYDEKKKEKIQYSDIYYLSKQVDSLFLREVSEWYAQINAKEITRL